MSNSTYREILDKFIDYKDQIEYVTLFFMGEPLLDKTLPDKIKYSKDAGFRGLNIATNLALLTEETSKKLLDSGLDTIIFSVDGVKKETHEQIRHGINFEQAIRNAKTFIKLREKYDTNIFLRMIYQDSNKDEWEDYKSFWNKLVTRPGDKVMRFNIHNWGSSKKINMNDYSVEKIACVDVFRRMMILADGTLGFCCADDNGDMFKMGNVLKEDPIDLYNRDPYVKYRREMETGNIGKLKYCSTCLIPASRLVRDTEATNAEDLGS
jgi:sulfatase maturation enzyme AslB (radical SAM superfamily)